MTPRCIYKTKRFELDANGNLYTNTAINSSSIRDKVLATDTELNLIDNSLQVLISYTVTATDKGITKISCSGTDYAKFELYKNSGLLETLRSGPDRNIQFGPLSIVENDIIEVKVIHYVIGDTNNFEATIYGQ